MDWLYVLVVPLFTLALFTLGCLGRWRALSGRWVQRDRVREHRCSRPSLLIRPWVRDGREWVCAECDRRWRVHEFWAGTDTWREWRLVSPDDERVT